MWKSTMVACALLLTAGAAWADGPRDRERAWGFGWNDGLVLRRAIGQWEIGLAAGPNDDKDDSVEDSYHPDYPDSLQGSRTEEDGYTREAGFVRIEVARGLASRGDFVLSGMISGGYYWQNVEWDESDFDPRDGDMTRYLHKIDTRDRQLRAGIRLSWFPFPWLSLEREFGLVYHWSDRDEIYARLYSDEESWRRDERTGDGQSFNDFGSNDITRVSVIFWF